MINTTSVKEMINKTIELELYADYREYLLTHTIRVVSRSLANLITKLTEQKQIASIEETVYLTLIDIQTLMEQESYKKSSILEKMQDRITTLQVEIEESNIGKQLHVSVTTPLSSSSSAQPETEEEEEFVTEEETEEEEEVETEEEDEDMEEGEIQDDEENQQPTPAPILCEMDKRMLRTKIGNHAMTKEVQHFYDFMNKGDNPFLTFAEKSLPEQQTLLHKIQQLSEHHHTTPIVIRILESTMEDAVKAEVFERYRIHLRDGDDDGKFEVWLTTLLKIPFQRLVDPPTVTDPASFFQHATQVMDQAIYGHSHAKQKILHYLGQYLNHPSSRGFVMGIRGPMGNGKTTLVEKGISHILSRPFIPIPLGGASDASFLNGHSYTYVGSTQGMIIDSIIKAGVMNPILYFDELDKISDTPKGQEIIHLLIHLTDPSQNHHFQDRYFGNIQFDLSKCVLIFSYNHREMINPILLDRIFEVKTEGFLEYEKIQIAKEFLIPDILRDIGLPLPIPLEEECYSLLIRNYTNEMGVRKLKELLYEIYRQYNLDRLLSPPPPTKRLRRGKQPTPECSTPRPITREYILETCLPHKIPLLPERIHSTPTVGKINGLYFSQNRNGGIIPIQAVFMHAEKQLDVLLTGNLGKVMQESSAVAKTVAWNLLSRSQQEERLTQWNTHKVGIHVHCSDTSIEKDGPSAGCALTLVFYSLLMNLPLRHDIGVTGEIDLSGNVTAIGGLREKMYGAKQSGCRQVLFPSENLNDYRKIQRECMDLFDSTFSAHPVKTIQEAIAYVIIQS